MSIQRAHALCAYTILVFLVAFSFLPTANCFWVPKYATMRTPWKEIVVVNRRHLLFD